MVAHEEVDIGVQYSPTPAGRYPADGPYNGQRFRKEFLVPALSRGNVIVRIDSVEGYGSSFLEEAFGGLVRSEGYSAEDLRKKMTIEYNDTSYRGYENLIWNHIDSAKPSTNGGTSLD